MIHKAPTWHPPQVSDVKAQVVAWLQQNVADAALRAKALAIVNGIGDQATGSELLDRLAETFAVVDPKVAQLVEICSHPRSRLVLPTFAWLTDSKTAPLVAANMRLYYGRWLVQGQWFEEALEQLGGLKTADVVAPAELLFYQGVTYHRMLNKEEGLKVINQLLDGAETSPRRYVAVAYLMQADLSSLEEETLDHIARRMEDVQRRLDLGRAGPKVRKVEDGVIESLDKMIKKIEDEQNKQNQSQSNSLQSSSPAKDSTPMAARPRATSTRKTSATRAAGATCRPRSAKKPCSRWAAISPRTIATPSRSTSANWPPKRAATTMTNKPDQLMHAILPWMVLSALAAAPQFDVQLLDGSRVSGSLVRWDAGAVGHRDLGRPHHAGRGQAGLGDAAKAAGKPRGEAGRVGRPGRRFATGGRGIHRGERPGQDRLFRRRDPGSADRRDRRRALSADFRGDGLGVVADPRQEDSRRRAGDRQFQRHRLSPGRD